MIKNCNAGVGGYVTMINDVHDPLKCTHASVRDDEQQSKKRIDAADYHDSKRYSWIHMTPADEASGDNTSIR